MKKCLSHIHYACPCREEAFKNLLAAAKDQHEAIDLLFAMLIMKDKKFYPSESGRPWKAALKGIKAIASVEKVNS